MSKCRFCPGISYTVKVPTFVNPVQGAAVSVALISGWSTKFGGSIGASSHGGAGEMRSEPSSWHLIEARLQQARPPYNDARRPESPTD